MKKLDFGSGLKIAGVYRFEQYPNEYVLCTDLSEDSVGTQYLVGFIFSEDGRFKGMNTIVLPNMGEEVGYIWEPNSKGFSLNLNFHNR